MGRSRTAVRALTAAVLAMLTLTACGSAPTPFATPAVYSGFVAASEFVVGTDRFPFGLLDMGGTQLEGAAVSVRFYKVNGEESTFKTEANAKWREVESTTVHVHADGQRHVHVDFRGLYVVDEVEFDEPGIWIAEFSALQGGNQVPQLEKAAFEVLAEPQALAVGDPAPAIDNPTLDDKPFAELSSRQVETDDLHNVSVADALDDGEPFVVIFASPQFCVSAMCGPVVDSMDKARAELGGDVPFIHIEPYDLDVARNEGKLVASPYLAQWNLTSEPWVFVVGADGRIAARFEGLVTGDEVVAAVEKVR